MHALPPQLEHFAHQAFTALCEQHSHLDWQALKPMLLRLFAQSDFAARVIHQYADALHQQLNEWQDARACLHHDYHRLCQDALQNVVDEPGLHAALRQFRHLHMLAICCHDLVYEGDIQDSLSAVSRLADALIDNAYLCLHKQLTQRYGEPNPAQEMLILGMGKLGGRELNFSSDIDLIFVYGQNGETTHRRKPIEHQTFFTRLGQKLISALHQVTADGQVYRVDMRLRPLGESGPLVLPMTAFEAYYQEQGREWERFAMQKMRVINASRPSNQDLIDELNNVIRPFVYRKYLDFTTIESLRKMKHMIQSEVARRQLGRNIKLGKGGIREVEFLVQSIQLIHAGRINECQTRGLLRSLAVLSEYQLIEPEISEQLKQDYLLLRLVAHRLQQLDDQQTQELPLDPLDQLRVAYACRCSEYTELVRQIMQAMDAINKEFGSLVREDDNNKSTNNDQQQIFSDIWQLSLQQDEAANMLSPYLPGEIIDKVVDELMTFKHKCQKHAIGERGQHTLAKLLPLLMEQIFFAGKGSYVKNHGLLKHILAILLTIVGRTTYLDLLLENPDVRQRLVFLCARSSWIAQQICQFPLLLDELLHPAYLEQDQDDWQAWHEEYEDELRLQLLRIEPDDVEAQMDALRHFKLTQQLRIAAADISGNIPINKVSDKLTLLAEVILQHVIQIAWHQMTERYGEPAGKSNENKGLGVIGYGKLGGIELGYGSDLDVVFIHDADVQKHTNGKQTVSNTEFYVKLVQRISHLFNTKTYLAQLYELDLRLRPSGNSGLLVTHINSFAQYQMHEAWTWEHQALVRARFIFGDNALQQAFTDVRKQVLQSPRVENELRLEVHNMRDKMRQHLDKSNSAGIDIKQSRGGIADIEFMVQFWVLAYACEHEQLCTWTDNLRIIDSLIAVNLLSEQQGQSLQSAYLSLRDQSHLLSLKERSLCENNDELAEWMTIVREQYCDLFKCGDS